MTSASKAARQEIVPQAKRGQETAFKALKTNIAHSVESKNIPYINQFFKQTRNVTNFPKETPAHAQQPLASANVFVVKLGQLFSQLSCQISIIHEIDPGILENSKTSCSHRRDN